MKLGDLLARLDRVQRSRGFKIAASAVAGALAVVAFAALWVAITSAPDPFAGVNAPVTAAQSRGLEAAGEAAATAANAAAERLNELRERSGGGGEGLVALAVSLGAGVGVLLAAALVVIWLGLTLTYLGLFVAAGALAAVLLLSGAEAYARLVAGVAVMTATFTALLQGLRLLLSGSHPVTAVAKNVLSEAVRLKISLVFIVLLILGMSALPGVLAEDQPLRYRVQTFLQFGTTGTFVLLAVLTLLFGCATVAFEQRDRVIWQTMTKPVSVWQYLLGKWAGIAALNAVLLAVCASGVFLFTEYLRGQPANGEVAAYVAAGQEELPPEQRLPTEDRMILESQVLVARRSVTPTAPIAPDDPDLQRLVAERIEQERRAGTQGVDTAAFREKIASDLYKSVLRELRNIPPAMPPFGERVFTFEGLGEARTSERPITLRYKPSWGSNAPDETYPLTFVFADGSTEVRTHAPGVFHTMALRPTAVDELGTLELSVLNGRLFRAPNGSIGFQPNPKTARFEEGDLEVSYSVGSYRANFLRVVAVLWLKLAFLGMVAVTASTFLSFPVAALVSLGFFFIAEMSGYLTDAVTFVHTTDDDGNFLWFQGTATYVATFVSRGLRVYSDLRPAGRLVEGRVLPWSQLALAASVFLAAAGVLFAAGGAAMRRRELAVYSGQ